MGNKSLNYSVRISPPTPEDSGIYTNPEKVLPLSEAEGVHTLKELVLRALLLFPDQIHLTSRSSKGNYVGKTFRQEIDTAVQIGSAIKCLALSQKINDGLNGGELEVVGVFSKNCEEWVILDMAAMLFGYTVVPLHDNFSPDLISYALEVSEVNTLFISGQRATDMLKVSDYHKLKNLIIFDDIDNESVKLLVSRKLKVLSWEQIREVGINNPTQELGQFTQEKIHSLCFTSGSSGKPKPAMISHGNFLAPISATKNFYSSLGIGVGSRHLSFLPMTHVYERFNILWSIYFGAQLFIYSGDIKHLKKDIMDAKPHRFASVPRLYNRTYDSISAVFDRFKGLKRLLIQRAIKTKLSNLKNYGLFTHGIYDKLFFNDIKKTMGENINFLSCGSAPLSDHVANMLKICFCCPLIEGFGQTEATGPVFLTKPEDQTTGIIGGPVPSCEFKIVNIPESGYLSSDEKPKGELHLRRPFVFKGYLKDKEKTRETLTDDGWLRTGDVVTLLSNGSLKIIDRKNNIFKLSQGEYVAPEILESKYLICKFISEIWITGDSLENFLVAVVVPNKDLVMMHAKKNEIQGNFEQLCQTTELRKFILNELNKTAEQQKLLGFERVKEIYLEPISMVANGICTPSLKIRRKECKIFYSSAVKQMYENAKVIVH